MTERERKKKRETRDSKKSQKEPYVAKLVATTFVIEVKQDKVEQTVDQPILRSYHVLA